MKADDDLEAERYELRERPPLRGPLRLARRSLFRWLGGGVAVVAVDPIPRKAAAQRPPRDEESGGRGGGAEAPELGSWIHVGVDGAVTVFTGKAEVGQDIRTSLTQAVCEELPVAPARVRLVMADTALVPFDQGTFGSRTTPVMFPQLRRVAATAREVLCERAATLLNVDRASLTATEGAVVHVGSGRRLTFAEVAAGEKLLVPVRASVALVPAARWTVAGQSAGKVDGRAIVTGARRYSSDLSRPGLLRGKILRAPRFGVRLSQIDDKAAARVPGSRIVRDGDFVGVVAPDEPTAARVLAALRPRWTAPEGPAVSNAELFEHLRGPKPGQQEQGQPGQEQGQTQGQARRGDGDRGDVDKALTAGKHMLSATYTAAYIAHVPLEPRAAVAEWDGERLTVWTGTQRPFGVRRELAEALRIPEDRVRVIVPDTGSGYGGKHTGDAAVEAARLARAAGKPVKVVWTREEEMTWAYFRPAGVVDIKSAADADGRLTAWQMDNYNSGGSALRTPYEVPNLRQTFHGARSPLRQGSYRGLASTFNNFARESHMDELAAACGQDPLKFRLRHLPGPPAEARLRAVLEAAAERFRWGSKQATRDLGYGLACGTDKGGYVATCAEVAVGGAGAFRVVRAVTAFECGAIVNPDNLRNQIEGSVIMGLGGALTEGIEFADGRITNARLSRYRVPRFSDVPVLETVLLDRKDLPSAGAGESPIIGIAPAIANALFAATGERLRGLPLRRAG